MPKLLALDQSSRITGWAIFNDGKLVKYGKFNAELISDNIGERLEYIRNKVKELINENGIEEVIIEDIQMQGNVVNNVQTFKTLAEVFGVISELLVEMKIPQSAVLASSWKSALGIKGRARAEQKRNAQQWVVDTYSVKPTQDECDAICIGAHKNKNSADVGFDWAD
jgi:Holliday junction resolvasome RuvABC endonuclease subunit